MLGLNWANVTGLNTNVTNTLPFTGEIYTVNVPTAANVALSGRVTTSDGRGIRNATVSISGGNLANPMFARTGSFGYFSFNQLEAGQTYIVAVNSKRFTFQVPSRVISLTDNLTDVDFVADP